MSVHLPPAFRLSHDDYNCFASEKFVYVFRLYGFSVGF
jgi:hypothetical protein